MPRIVSMEAGDYRVPLEATLGDSLHGDMPAKAFSDEAGTGSPMENAARSMIRSNDRSQGRGPRH
ncbi:hypothetical protein [Methylobacterium indicum]|uniref:hypothetical protein n=1 Tax=Methylobacterium indicum TaxID=1775910 RepID=UPI0024358053|nr:hypothetical protein [Methylobacterium indicum]